MSGQSIGAIIGGIIGVVLAPFTGGTSLAISASAAFAVGAAVGGVVGGLLDPPDGTHLQGPRLGDLSQTTSTYGAVIPRIYAKTGMFGNVFWIENNKLKEVSTTETQGGKGGAPSSSFTTYTYFGTFALGLCQGEIKDISRIWFANKLWYSAIATDAATQNESNIRRQKFKVYKGAETQMPDPRMQADVGVEDCPAYRGLAYIVFYDIDLFEYGNSIAALQPKVEIIDKYAVNSGKFNIVSHFYAGGLGSIFGASVIGNYVYYGIGQSVRVVNIEDINNPYLESGVETIPASFVPSALGSSGSALYVTNASTGSIGYLSGANPSALGSTMSALFSLGTGVEPQAIITDGNYAYTVNTGNNTISIINISNLSALNLVGEINVGVKPTGISVSSGYAYVVCADTDSLKIFDVINPASTSLISTVTVLDSPKAIAAYGDYVYIISSTINRLDTWNVTNKSAPVKVDSRILRIVGENMIASNDRLHVAGDGVIFDITNGIPVELKHTGYFDGTEGINIQLNTRALLNNGYMIIVNYNGWVDVVVVADYFVSEPSYLDDVVRAEVLQSDLLSDSDLQFENMHNDLIDGYRVGSVSTIRSSIETLQGIWPFDLTQVGYKIKIKRRGNPNGALINVDNVSAYIYEDNLMARPYGEKSGDKMVISYEMARVLPNKITINYQDAIRDYDVGSQYHERLIDGLPNESIIEVSAVMTANQAKGAAETLLNLYWSDRYDYSFTISPDPVYQLGKLMPTDIVYVKVENKWYLLRIISINYHANGIAECKAKLHERNVYNAIQYGEEGLLPDGLIDSGGPSFFDVLDIPMLDQSYNSLGLITAITGIGSGWGGGIVEYSNNNGDSFANFTVETSPGTVMGVVTNYYPKVQDTRVMDKGSQITVRLYQGALSTVTEAELYAGKNYFAYEGVNGWEIIGARKCQLQVDGSWLLTDLLRGCFGTEINTIHEVNKRLISLDITKLKWHSMGYADIGQYKLYRARTAGSLTSTSSKSVTFNANSLKPLSPVYVNAYKDPVNDDITITWVRRTRLNDGWRDSVDAGLGETSESYQIEITEGAFVIIKRTLSSTSESVVYTGAQQILDYGVAQSTIYVNIYQMSSTVGRGFPAHATLNV